MIDKALLSLVGFLTLVLVVFIAFVVSMSPTKTTDTAMKPPLQKTSDEPAFIEQSSGPSPSPQSVYIPTSGASGSVARYEKLVQDADLNSLASMVNLSGAKTRSPRKDQWKAAIPLAEKLLEGPCDCEQRNWLKQFVIMGNYALAESPQYHESARLMDNLPLNDLNVHTRYNPTN